MGGQALDAAGNPLTRTRVPGEGKLGVTSSEGRPSAVPILS